MLQSRVLSSHAATQGNAVSQARPTASAPFWHRRPASAALHGLVTDIVGYGENGRGLAGEVETASLVAPLIISFGDPFSIALGRAPSSNDRWSSFAAGLYPGPVVMDSTGAAACVQVNFTPQGAHRFFGLPMSELAARMVALDDLGDRDILRLAEQLGAQPDWGRRMDITERFVTARLRQAPGADAGVNLAYRRILASRGKVRISQVARDLGWSRKHLTARFHRELGLAPKSIARITRFNNVLWQARAGSVGWADVATACGYADQAHLTREFLEMSGTTPSRWLARLAGNGAR
jgi:AraC-like DNA-binding protein